MKLFTRTAAALAVALLSSAVAMAQGVVIPDVGTTPSGVYRPTDGAVIVNPNNGTPCPVGNTGCPGLPISGTITASLGGFQATAGATASLTLSTTSSSVALPAGATVTVYNPTSVTAYVRLTSGASTAVTTDQAIPPGVVAGFTVGTATTFSAISASAPGATNTLTVQGGSGLFTWVAGGGSGGGGGAITAASGSYSAGALGAGSIVDLGTGASPAANTVNARLQTINSTLGSPLQAGGTVALSASPPGSANFPTSTFSAGTTTGSTIALAARTGRQSVTVENTGTTPVYLSGTSGVTSSTGFLLPGVLGASLTINYSGALYAVTASGTAALSISELY